MLTGQTDTAHYMATMEAAYRAKENQLFYNIPQTSYSKALVPGGYPTDNTTVPNDSLARTNGSNNKVGLALVLKVMSGDKVDIAVKSFYRGSGAGSGTNDPISDILTSLATGIVGVAGESKGTLSALGNSGNSPLLGALNSFRNAENATPSNKPKAYLNWILLDEQLQYVAASSGADLIKDTGNIYALTSGGPVTMTRNGFLYIYVSNETQNRDVFFDNLSVQHYTGPLTEETHYYPFGLTMAGISSKAVGMLDNKYEFNGIEHNEVFDLNMYDAFYRNLDPQTGRFWQVDPKIESAEAWSPYSAMLDDPIKNIDPLGDSTKPGFFQGFKDGFTGFFSSAWDAVTHPVETVKKAFSTENLTNTALNTVTGGVYGIVKQNVDAVQTVNEKGIYGLGEVTGNTTAQVTTVAVLEGASKVVNGLKSASGVSQETTTLYRGVNESHPGFDDAVNGIAKPRGGTATTAEHNAGNTLSPYTSWTTDWNVATNYALRPNGTGVVLETTVAKTATVHSPSLKSVNLIQSPGTVVNESEVLLRGPVTGAKVKQPN